MKVKEYLSLLALAPELIRACASPDPSRLDVVEAKIDAIHARIAARKRTATDA